MRPRPSRRTSDPDGLSRKPGDGVFFGVGAAGGVGRAVVRGRFGEWYRSRRVGQPALAFSGLCCSRQTCARAQSRSRILCSSEAISSPYRIAGRAGQPTTQRANIPGAPGLYKMYCLTTTAPPPIFDHRSASGLTPPARRSACRTSTSAVAPASSHHAACPRRIAAARTADPYLIVARLGRGSFRTVSAGIVNYEHACCASIDEYGYFYNWDSRGCVRSCSCVPLAGALLILWSNILPYRPLALIRMN